eukprot:2241123-Amphidinium_carterae.1
MSHHYGEAFPETYELGRVRRYATIRMGSCGIVWVKPPNTQCTHCLAFEDQLRAALWLRFESAGHA